MTVLQTWLEQIPIRMQSTLLLSLRGPDTHRAPEIKKVQRWMRGLTFKPDNPDNVREFMTDRHGSFGLCAAHANTLRYQLKIGLEVIPDGVSRKDFFAAWARRFYNIS